MISIDFSALDDLCLAAQMNPKRLQSLQQPVVTANLGVAIELVLFRTLGTRQAIDDLVEVNFSTAQPLIRLWRQGHESSLSADLP